MNRTILISLSLIILAFSSFAQGPPEAKLFDEIGPMDCEEYTIRIQGLYIRLASNLPSRGVIVISGNGPSWHTNLLYERWLWGYVKFNHYDPRLISEIRGSDRGNLRIQFWMVPEGAADPKVETSTWNFSLRPTTKPVFLFSDNQNSLCYIGNQEKILLEYLVANPGFDARIVIRSKTMKEFLATKTGILQRFGANDTRRISFVYKRDRYENDVEWWLAPLRKER